MRQEFYDRRAVAIMECAKNGLSRHEAAQRLCMSYPTIGKYAKRYGVKFVRPGIGPADEDRADAMDAMYRAGKTLEDIGGVFGVSRERVRQIITKYRGTTAKDGGQAFKAKIARDRKIADREAASLRKHGCSWKQYKSLLRIGREMRAAGHGPATTPAGAFHSQRCNSAKRSIEWNLTLWDWWQIWQASGHWEQRGRGKGYMMCRFGDTGAYEIGNVYIATGVHNASVQPGNPYRTNHPRFDEVMAARRAREFMRAGSRRMPDTIRPDGLPTGVTLCKRTGRYQAQIAANGRSYYLGRFPTAESAHSAYIEAFNKIHGASFVIEMRAAA